MNSILKLISLLSRAEKRRLVLVTATVVVAAFLEVAGIGALGPFISLVSNPEMIHTEPTVRWFYTMGGFQTERAFVLTAGIAMFTLILVANIVKMGTQYLIQRFIGLLRHGLGLRLFGRYLHQPYTFYIEHNTTELSKNMLSEVDLVMGGVLLPAMTGLAQGLVVVAILALLVGINPVVALVALSVLSSVYLLTYLVLRGPLAKYGQQVRSGNLVRYKTASEAFGAIKDVKILGKEGAFERMYSAGAKQFVLSEAARNILSVLPKYALEAVAFGLVVLLVILLVAAGDDVAHTLPLLAVYGFAAYKLLPALQQVYGAFAQARYYSYTVDALQHDFALASGPSGAGAVADGATMSPDDVQRLDFADSVRLDGVWFSYPGSEEPTLKEIGLRIDKNSAVGFVGTTGCGKTTLVDVIMCLLDTSAGQILIDEEPVGNNTRSWQRSFGYVPQSIFLADDTMAANIAFGVPEDERDPEAVRRAAAIAKLDEFVENELPQGYGTVIGERGIRLSGGQRQRIGIARALYHDPSILVMDEATSALDTVTEDAIMDAIHNLMHTKTIVIIAHRTTTVMLCDVIHLMDRGRIVATGTYDELIAESSRFRAMAKVQ